jgi:proton-dependent oligopeptide transporter, POT family
MTRRQRRRPTCDTPEPFNYYSLTEGGLGMPKATATGIVGAYGGLVYLSTVLGGWIADRVLGMERTVLYGGVVVMFGHIALALIPAWLASPSASS